jgi:predicted NBD/HSP70 family sugar kinase
MARRAPKDVRRSSLISAADTLATLEIIRSSSSPVLLMDLIDAGHLPAGRERQAIRTLERRGLIERQDGDRNGQALRLRPKPPGWILGVDVGGTKMRACLADGHGDLLIESVQPTSRGAPDELGKQIAALHHELCAKSGVAGIRAEAACVGIPASYDADLDRASKADNLLELHDIRPRAAFSEALGMPVTVAQDSHLAAVAEKWRGWARGWDDYVVICIGTGISMGIVLNGEIYQGGHGAAGEIADLPIGNEPIGTGRGLGRTFEDAVSGLGIARRYAISREVTQDARGPVTDAKGVFEAAQGGDQTASCHVEHEAALVALGIIAVGAVLDPGLVVLGGGVGSNSMLLGLVRDRVSVLTPRPPQIETSSLADAGPLFGAVAVGLATAPNSHASWGTRKASGQLAGGKAT